ncbi:hypothetical protein X728_26285 [Mesorhizobium sp. L103C120A0]|nr:hypothetical protein X728_26285 [Mesorhizobium sp. L103C120A0]
MAMTETGRWSSIIEIRPGTPLRQCGGILSPGSSKVMWRDKTLFSQPRRRRSYYRKRQPAMLCVQFFQRLWQARDRGES